ncbi:right-handed parallel beta-helix repeat-containing protein [Candidatus Desantisbacteria bacterium]|nr:right-handed parallel beta-helix repeat-containing protein [Candidatus Desantisbacteria bacterium]
MKTQDNKTSKIEITVTISSITDNSGSVKKKTTSKTTDEYGNKLFSSEYPDIYYDKILTGTYTLTNYNAPATYSTKLGWNIFSESYSWDLVEEIDKPISFVTREYGQCDEEIIKTKTYNRDDLHGMIIGISQTAKGTCTLNKLPTIDGALISGFMITGATNTGIVCFSSSPIITNNTISGNNSGINCEPFSSPTITNNTISENGEDGIDYGFSSPTITNNTVSGNGRLGIGCWSSSPNSTIMNNIITGNTACGIYCNSSSPIITNNTISENVENGIYCYSSSSPIITNNIIAENGTTDISCYGISVCLPGTPVIDYNDVWRNGLDGNNNYYSVGTGTHDISLDPQFIGGGDFHLQSTPPYSSCIDAGSNIAQGITSTDKDGNPRVVRTVDMGAYEYQGVLLTAAKIKIEDETGQEISTKTLTTDGRLTLILRGYTAEDVLIGDIAGTWTVIGEIGTCTPKYGRSTVFNPTTPGIGTISVEYGTLTDTTELITIEIGNITEIKIVDSGDQELGTMTLTTDGTQTFYLRGYDNDNNLVYVSGTWTVFGGIGTCTPEYGTSTIFNPTTVGIGIISAEYGTLTNTTGTITVNCGIPTSLIIVSGDSQQSTVTTTLQNPFIVKLTDTYSNLVDSYPVIWQMIEPSYGAILSATTTTTNILMAQSLLFLPLAQRPGHTQ